MRLEPDEARWGKRHCSTECAGVARRRKPGDRTVDAKSGYAWVTTDDGKAVMEHRLVMERLLGRPLLTEETIHHLTGGFAGRSNNRPENLELWTGKHPKGHRVEDVVGYSREMLALYGDAAERERYLALTPATLTP
jgi:hypothetical protein